MTTTRIASLGGAEIVKVNGCIFKAIPVELEKVSHFSSLVKNLWDLTLISGNLNNIPCQGKYLRLAEWQHDMGYGIGGSSVLVLFG